MYELKSPTQNFMDGVPISSVTDFEAGKLNPWQMALLLQDILEAKILNGLPARYLIACAYYAQMGLISTQARARH